MVVGNFYHWWEFVRWAYFQDIPLKNWRSLWPLSGTRAPRVLRVFVFSLWAKKRASKKRGAEAPLLTKPKTTKANYIIRIKILSIHNPGIPVLFDYHPFGDYTILNLNRQDVNSLGKMTDIEFIVVLACSFCSFEQWC
jgi:hypothetical protein